MQNLRPPRRHIVSDLESSKFENKRDDYYKYISELKKLNYEFEDFLHYFTCFTGEFTLSRILTLYEAYKSTSTINGHIADVGMFKGASSIFFAKLISLYENHSLCQVHGFDWFKGNKVSKKDPYTIPLGGKESEARVRYLVELQNLQNILKIHNLDLKKDLSKFFKNYPHLKFKLIFMDCGMYDVLKSAIPYFWERLSIGGMIIFDQYNFDSAQGETLAVDEFFKKKNVTIHSFQNSWMPTAYILKNKNV